VSPLLIKVVFQSIYACKGEINDGLSIPAQLETIEIPTCINRKAWQPEIMYFPTTNNPNIRNASQFKTYTICDLLVAAVSKSYTVHARPTINVAKRKNDGRDVGYQSPVRWKCWKTCTNAPLPAFELDGNLPVGLYSSRPLTCLAERRETRYLQQCVSVTLFSCRQCCLSHRQVGLLYTITSRISRTLWARWTILVSFPTKSNIVYRMEYTSLTSD
jgi:hypothetical protein